MSQMNTQFREVLLSKERYCFLGVCPAERIGSLQLEIGVPNRVNCLQFCLSFPDRMPLCLSLVVARVVRYSIFILQLRWNHRSYGISSAWGSHPIGLHFMTELVGED